MIKVLTLFVLTVVVAMNFHTVSGYLRLIYKGDLESKAWYQRLVHSQQTQQPDDGSIILLGDSILYGLPLRHINACPLYNFAIPGETAHLLERRVRRLQFDETTEVLILIGINDLGINRTPQHTAADIQAIVRYLQPHVASVTLGTLLPTDDFVRDNAQIRHLNMLIGELAMAQGVAVIDFTPELLARFSSAEQFTTDGLHLTAAAYEVAANVISTHFSHCMPVTARTAQ